MIITFFQYKKYTRFNAPNNYDYVTGKDIDLDYFDPLVLQQYFENANKIGTYARSQWYNHGIDVLYPGEDESNLKAANHYNNLISVTKVLETKLMNSQVLKKRGFANNDIRYMEEHSLSEKQYHYLKNQRFLELGLGMVSQEVWELQDKLQILGYSMPKDGNFGLETEKALRDFQEKSGLFPSGAMNEATLDLLFELKQ